jgi:hypothetical protein
MKRLTVSRYHHRSRYMPVRFRVEAERFRLDTIIARAIPRAIPTA